jgi:hypothetical protein
VIRGGVVRVGVIGYVLDALFVVIVIVAGFGAATGQTFERVRLPATIGAASAVVLLALWLVSRKSGLSRKTTAELTAMEGAVLLAGFAVAVTCLACLVAVSIVFLDAA